MKLLLAEGIDEQVAKDYLVVRETKKAALTKTALDGNKREANKAGITLEAAIRVCIENNWRAFIAEWYANRNKNKSSDPSVKNDPKPSVKEIPEHTKGGVQAWL